MSFSRRLGPALFNMTPAYSRTLFKVCQRYVDRFNGDNDPDAATNEEFVSLRRTLSNLGPGVVVFDVGANTRTWVASALEMNAGMDLDCFEPSKATYSKLMQWQWPSNIRTNNYGLGETQEVGELHVVEDGSGMNSLYARQGVDGFRETATEQIDITTIDAYCRVHGIEQIDLLKVDVEGHELAVFKGATRMFATQAIHAIQFGYGGCNLDAQVNLADIWSFLAAQAFGRYKLYPDGARQTDRYHQSLETFKYSNCVAIRRAVETGTDPS